MPKDTFHDAFSYEGDALERAGFTRPNDELSPKGYIDGKLGGAESKLPAYSYEKSEAERQQLGIDIDTWRSE